MEFRFAHNGLYVLDLQRSIEFYRKALGLTPVRTMRPADQDAELVFLSDGQTPHELELACLAGRTAPYELGDNLLHLSMSVPDIDAAKALHESMGIIVRDPVGEPVYFIRDPDGYIIEIIPQAKE